MLPMKICLRNLVGTLVFLPLKTASATVSNLLVSGCIPRFLRLHRNMRAKSLACFWNGLPLKFKDFCIQTRFWKTRSRRHSAASIRLKVLEKERPRPELGTKQPIKHGLTKLGKDTNFRIARPKEKGKTVPKEEPPVLLPRSILVNGPKNLRSRRSRGFKKLWLKVSFFLETWSSLEMRRLPKKRQTFLMRLAVRTRSLLLLSLEVKLKALAFVFGGHRPKVWTFLLNVFLPDFFRSGPQMVLFWNLPLLSPISRSLWGTNLWLSDFWVRLSIGNTSQESARTTLRKVSLLLGLRWQGCKPRPSLEVVGRLPNMAMVVS